MDPFRQPHLHRHLTCVRAPTTWLSPPDGQLRRGADGLYVADRRVLSRFQLTVDGVEPVPLSACEAPPDTATFVGHFVELGEFSPDPTVWCERRRRADVNGGTEIFTLVNAAREAVAVQVDLAVAADFAALTDVKGGEAGEPAPARSHPDGLRWSAADGLTVSLRTSITPQVDAGAGVLRWQVVVPARGAWTLEIQVTCTPPSTPGFRPLAAAVPPPWHDRPLSVRAGDARLDRLVATGVADLSALLLSDPLRVTDLYASAGSPWYLTMFGRDALWTAQLAMPLGPELAGSTLRALARRQGTRVDVQTEEEPGKIPHELRPADAARWLPPVYYGTIDATPLFVLTLVEAWRWGLAGAEVAELLPAMEKALDWMAKYGDADGDGFIEYVPAGPGLSNQGWKDSRDGIQYADGRLATAPIALAEVQAYAYRAVMEGAVLLDAFDRPGGQWWRTWARDLAERFRDAFWISDEQGPYPAIALEAGKKPVDGPASNMGHLLGMGLLSAQEEEAVARRLIALGLNSGYGLRTLADTAKGFNPLSYHAGSVWPHDTAIAALNLSRGGHPRDAGSLIMGLLAAAPAFGFRLPELYGGQRAEPPMPPPPYPASCRPQSWAAAVGPAAVRALLGLAVDLPHGRVGVAPIAPSPVGPYTVRGIRLGADGVLDVSVDASGAVIDVRAPAGVTVDC